MSDTDLAKHLADLVRLHGAGGDLTQAKARAGVTRAIYESYGRLRGLIHELGNGRSAQPNHTDARAWCDKAQESGLLFQRAHSYRAVDGGARSYLSGVWLEELVALAMLDAACPDVRFGQRIKWQAAGDPEEHYNEIDAICRYNQRLVIVSCKATAIDLLDRSRGEERILDALLELSYWNTHFCRDEALPIFVTTTDFFDEEAQTFRSSKLMERARVLGLHVITADFSTYAAFKDKLTSILAKH